MRCVVLRVAADSATAIVARPACPLLLAWLSLCAGAASRPVGRLRRLRSAESDPASAFVVVTDRAVSGALPQ